MIRNPWAPALAVCVMMLAGCDDRPGNSTGTVKIDGSSTVEPISTMAAYRFRESHPNIDVRVGTSGTGGGFKKFLDAQPHLRTDINNASRPISPGEIEKARQLGVEFIELPIALDGIAVVVHPGNDFVDHLTVEELKHVFEQGSAIDNWKDVRDGFPDLPLKLFGPGTDSGTYDYFVEYVIGESKAGRLDSVYSASENDNVLVQGVIGERGALGYFGFAYYQSYADRLKLLGIDNGDGRPVKPTMETIQSGTYAPLSRPLFLYVNKASLQRPAASAFLDFYFTNAVKIVQDPHVGYVALPDDLYELVRNRVKAGVTGSPMASVKPGEPLDLARLYGVPADEAATTRPAEARTRAGS